MIKYRTCHRPVFINSIIELTKEEELMNWLMYIGGGFIWTLLSIGIFNVSMPKDNELKETVKIFRYIWLLASTMVWIWICWRFIK